MSIVEICFDPGTTPQRSSTMACSSLYRNVGEFDNYCRDGLLGFFSILDGITYKIETPELRERRILGGSFGWFTTVHGNSEMQLFQPLTKKIVCLPALSKFPFVAGTRTDDEERLIYSLLLPDETVIDVASGYMRDTLLCKAMTFFYPDRSSSHPSIVVVLPGIFSRLHFCRPGKDDCWNVIPKGDYGYHDFTFYKGNFYALRINGTLDIMNCLDGLSPPIVSLVASVASVEDYEADHYLLASSDDLWKGWVPCSYRGVRVEVVGHGHDKEYNGSVYEATILTRTSNGHYLEQHQNIPDTKTGQRMETVGVDLVRPLPPQPPSGSLQVDRLVEVWINSSYWLGKLVKIETGGKYTVKIVNSREERVFRVAEIRVHQSYVNGQWVLPYIIMLFEGLVG
ncbi:hypothetical protein IFM89_020660 [Coptis chinensis]|uniref:Agenet domain-containing protein n=1 Tax=Coptis chinensis TaxID=261450 RepID=A0A835LE81_9MAGN|nr:hypothetical protein IFM89_020660 [Coptis chinensis]